MYIFTPKNVLKNFMCLCFAVKEKKNSIDTFWQPHFPSGNWKKISVTSWRLPKKANFKLCIMNAVLWLTMLLTMYLVIDSE